MMQNTMELLSKALTVKRASRWCEDMNLDVSTMAQAKKRGRLSPVIAGNLAIELGESPEHWMAIAAMEAEPESPLLQRLRKSQENWRKLLLTNNTKRTRKCGFFSFKGRVAGLFDAVNRTFDSGYVAIKDQRQIRQ